MIAPIETTWRDIRYRSRTEARWAVLLTAAGVPFEYEREGYALPTDWYLPDFWLPAAKMWLEIKGQEPTAREQALAQELAAATGVKVWLAVEAPNADDGDQVRLFTAHGERGVTLIHLDLNISADAYRRALSERFDGKPPTAPTPTKRARFRAHGW